MDDVSCFLFLIRRQPSATLTATLFPDPTLFRSGRGGRRQGGVPRGRAVHPSRPVGAGDPPGEQLLAAWRAGNDRLFARRRARLADRGETSAPRSEEHTSELQSLMRISYAVFCL